MHWINHSTTALSTRYAIATGHAFSHFFFLRDFFSRKLYLKNFNIKNFNISHSYMKLFTTSGSISPLRPSKYFLRSWSQCSNTRVSFLSLCRTSMRRTTFLWRNSFSRQISRRADEGTPCRSKHVNHTKRLNFKYLAMKGKRDALII